MSLKDVNLLFVISEYDEAEVQAIAYRKNAITDFADNYLD